MTQYTPNILVNKMKSIISSRYRLILKRIFTHWLYAMNLVDTPPGRSPSVIEIGLPRGNIWNTAQKSVSIVIVPRYLDNWYTKRTIGTQNGQLTHKIDNQDTLAAELFRATWHIFYLVKARYSFKLFKKHDKFIKSTLDTI